MSWTSLVYCLVIIVIAFVLLLMWAWPRDQDGEYMSIEDAEEVMKRFTPSGPPTGRGKFFIMMFFVTVAAIGVALTSKSNDKSSEWDD